MPKSALLIGDKWVTAVKPTVQKFRLPQAIGQPYTLTSAGAAALAALIEDMAAKLDIAEAYIKELSKKGD